MTYWQIGFAARFVTAGLHVPDDMAIVGYDDIAFAAAAAVPLSSVRQPRLGIGYRAAELLFDEIEANERDAPHEHEQVRFTPELVVRRSSAKSRNLFRGCRRLRGPSEHQANPWFSEADLRALRRDHSVRPTGFEMPNRLCVSVTSPCGPRGDAGIVLI